jgi:hypothetical protein
VPGRPRTSLLQCFLALRTPFVRPQRQELLEGKAPLQARRDAQRHLGRLDDHRTTATAGVVQWRDLLQGQDRRRLPPAGRRDHGRCQRFLQRRVALIFAPSTLEQRLARGVDRQAEHIGPQVRIQSHVGPGGVDAGPLPAALAEPVADGVLDAQRREVQAAQGAALGRHLDLDGMARREPVLPGQRARRRIQVVLAAVWAAPQLHQHALGQAAVQVEPHHLAPRRAQAHPRPVRADIGHAGDAPDFVGQPGLDTGGAGQEQV